MLLCLADYIEMVLWKTMGDLLEGSGWTSCLAESEIASAGTADSMLKAAHLTRTRHAHQVTLATLHILQQEAFSLSRQSRDNDTYTAWLKHMVEKSPTFMFWDLIILYETLILVFVRAHRENNFPLYVEVLEQLAPLFFALDHTNYARWLPIHIKDMKSLPTTIRDEFEKEGNWVISKTSNKFSSIPFDQAHEQENRYVKSSGGCIGLTENPSGFRRWMLSGPELSRLQRLFEDEYLRDDDEEDPKNFLNHEQGPATQRTFKKQVTALTETIQKMGNPFLDDFEELVTLDSRNCAEKSVVDGLKRLEETGKRQYEQYVQDVIVHRSSNVMNPIKKNSLPLFKRPQHTVTTTQGKKIQVLQNNVELFGQLYIYRCKVAVVT